MLWAKILGEKKRRPNRKDLLAQVFPRQLGSDVIQLLPF